MTAVRPLAVFFLTEPWLQKIVLEAAPAEFDVKFLDRDKPAERTALLPQADFLVTTLLPADSVALLKQCKLVQHQGVGYDGIDLAALMQAGIPLALTPEGTVIGVAEHVLLLILALSKQLVRVDSSMRHGEYDPFRWRPNSHLLSGRTMGIVGLGRIGRRVAHLASAFGAHLLYTDPLRASDDVERELGITFVSFDELLTGADIISVHTPLDDTTRGLFAAKEFARMKPGAYFINASRGETFDMNALYAALVSGHLGGAGLDVFNPEPPPADHPIFKLPNVICTPHMAAGTVEGHCQKAQAQFANFGRILRGETPLNLVRPA